MSEAHMAGDHDRHREAVREPAPSWTVTVSGPLESSDKTVYRFSDPNFEEGTGDIDKLSAADKNSVLVNGWHAGGPVTAYAVNPDGSETVSVAFPGCQTVPEPKSTIEDDAQPVIGDHTKE